MRPADVIQTIVPTTSITAKPAKPLLRDVSRRAPGCSSCSVQPHCVPVGLETAVLRELDLLVATRARVRKGETLYRPGDRFVALYAIRSGSCKTVLSSEDGREQVTGYHMAGDLIATDSIDSDVHAGQAVALEDMEACVLPFKRIEQLARDHAHLQHNLYRLLSREIARERKAMLMLGAMRADQRLAAFLLDLSQRYQARGYSSCEFVLRMTREEIGSYLGLKLETVSRLLSRFHRDGLLQVQGRTVKLLDRIALQQLASVSP